MKKTFIAYALVLMLITGATHAYGEENASNPLAAVNNTDVRWQYFDLDGRERNDFYLDGSYMLTPKLKLKYELHYWDTDVTGSSESDWESLHLKPIYFPKQGEWDAWKYKLAIGAEWIVDFGNEDKGIGSGSDQIAPLVGVALVRGEDGSGSAGPVLCGIRRTGCESNLLSTDCHSVASEQILGQIRRQSTR